MVTTRTKSYTYSTTSQESGGLELIQESLDDKRARWARLHREQHYESIISEVMDQEMPKYENSTVIDATDREMHKGKCLQILASAPSVMAAAAQGNLVRRMQTEPSLQQEYVAVLERALNQPSIYIHLLADRDGNAPTPNQYLKIRDFVIDYLSQAKGHRKYLHTTSRSDKRVETLELFCQGVQKRCDETPASLRDTPFRYPPTQHRAHQSSNYVMNLVEDICTHLHNVGIFEQHFIMHQFIVYLIFREEQARIAEIFISGLLQVWVKDGGGFNAYQAGHSVSTAGRVSDEEWASHERNTKLCSPMTENIRQQQLRADEWRRVLESTSANRVDGNMRGGSADEEEFMSIEQPRSYPAALLTKRHLIPNHLHIVIEWSSVDDIHSSKEFNYDALNKSSIEAHFQRNVASSFISLYETEDTASRKRPHTEKVRGKSQPYDAVKVEIDTTGMTPAWICVEYGVHIPVWFEQQSRQSEDVHNGEILWFCLEEVKAVFLMDNGLGEKGEWLACGSIPQGRVIIHSKSSDSEPPRRVFNDEEKHKSDRQARCDRIRTENERVRLNQQEFAHIFKKKESIKISPQIPNRKSSLKSLACKAVSEPKEEANKGSKLSLTIRNEEFSWTNAEPQRAASLMKYAILMAHEKKTEAERTWISDTAPSAGDLDRVESRRMIENRSHKEKHNDFAARDLGTPMTPPDSPKNSLRRPNTHERRGRENGEDSTQRYELAQYDDDQLSRNVRTRVHRSAAPSPSQSMLRFHFEGENEHSFYPRRSRRESLLELQSDQDSVLREYARVSLQDPTIPQHVASRTRHRNINEDSKSRIHNYEDSQSLFSLRDRCVTSTSSPPALVPIHNPPSSRGTRDEANETSYVNPRPPSLYSSMNSLASLSTFEHASIGEALYVSVEPASHVKEVEIRSKKESGSGPRSSGRESSVQSIPAPQLPVTEGDAQLEAMMASFPAYDLQVQPEQFEREALPPPQSELSPKSVSVPPAPVPTLTPVPSKSEVFLAKAKCLGEMGREITSRIAEIKERQSKPKAKKEKWDLGVWRSSDKKEKNGNRRIGEQDE
ncbi:uncharacterized protein ALTATR162_LOCUS2961 [Alternaria atra]|uniref:Uncharacterized protein n=1 Tax=Alternaria atra TaxID=119953 RepID=A0A8J2I4K3_9PLEO|nr:uncharacterized protein ALTATR162_LOCUS2961 [Alternaria atra]CAG5152916.1 unnamed protein product [Alternaria atra]